MGVIARFSSIMASNVNAMLDKCEDPAKMVDQYLREMKEDLANVKRETAGVMAEEARCKRQFDEIENDIQKYADLAAKAVTAGSDEDAMAFLSKKAECTGRLKSAQDTYAASKGNADKMRSMHNKLVGDIQALDAKRNQIKATYAVARTQKKINKIGDTSSAETTSRFGDMEDRVNNMLDRANAEAELNSSSDPMSELEDKYEKSNPAVADELAALKASLGK